MVLDLGLRLGLLLSILEVHAGRKAGREDKLEWNGVVAWHEGRHGELEAWSAVLEDFFLRLALLIMLLLATIDVTGYSINPTDFLSSLDFEDDLFAWAGGGPDSEIDGSGDGGAGVVDWLCCLHHHVTELVLATTIDVSHYESVFTI